MRKYIIFDVLLFVVSVCVSLLFAPLQVEWTTYLIVFFIYLFFSNIYSTLRIQQGSGNASFDYGSSYSQSFAFFAGPFGLLIFETAHRFSVYFHRKISKTADADEFTDTLYNIGSYVLNNTVAFIFFFSLYPYFQSIPFGYFVLFFLTGLVSSWQSNGLLLISFYLSGNIHSWSQVVAFFKNRSMFDIGKIALTNGLLYYFVMESQWEALIALFSLNYIVSKSFIFKQDSIQNELERDRFREMAYTDFMTGLYNRAWMDKEMTEINGTNENVGIVVADIDKFKRINDNYNHAVGDSVIQHFANTLRMHVNESDGLFRTGGEEFTLFLRGRSFEECVALIEMLRIHVSVNPIVVDFNGNQTSIAYTSSFGLYFDAMTDKLPMERAHIVADQLLLEAKGQGRNRLEIKNGLPTEQKISSLI